MKRVYQELAQLVGALNRCRKDDSKAEWAAKHRDRISELCREMLPHGSGFDSGCSLDLDRSTEERIVIHTAFHHMTEGGMYDGWTEHTVTVKPSLALGFVLTVSGRDRNQIKDYIGDTMHFALDEPLPE